MGVSLCGKKLHQISFLKDVVFAAAVVSCLLSLLSGTKVGTGGVVGRLDGLQKVISCLNICGGIGNSVKRRHCWVHTIIQEEGCLLN